MATPEVSVILSVYNRARNLPTLLSHLEQQSFPAADMELVVVDAGSTDGSHETTRRYAAGAPIRIHSLRQAFRGRAKALNMGVHESRGRWVLLIGEDLLASPNWVEDHVRDLEAIGTAGFTLGNISPHPQLRADALTKWFLEQTAPGHRRPAVLSWVDCSMENFGIARARALEANGFDEGYHTSLALGCDLAYRLTRKGLQPRQVEGAMAYVGFSRTFDEVSCHYYQQGHGLYRLARQTDPEAVEAAFPVRPSLGRRMLDTIVCPYYRQLCRETSGQTGLLTAMRRRVFVQQLYRGFSDARRGVSPEDAQL